MSGDLLILAGVAVGVAIGIASVLVWQLTDPQRGRPSFVSWRDAEMRIEELKNLRRENLFLRAGLVTAQREAHAARTACVCLWHEGPGGVYRVQPDLEDPHDPRRIG